MLPSGAELKPPPEDDEVPGQGLAIAAESLYLINLLVLPGLGFLALVYLYVKQRQHCPPLATCHLQQTLIASLWAGFLLVIANALIILLGSYTAPWTWVIVILYFTTCHSTLLLPPAEIYGNLWHGQLTRNQALFIGAETTLFFIDFVLARHLFCRYACAVGLFQSLAWMANRNAMVVGFDRARVRNCTRCYSACDHICPMRLHPRSVKRLMFACVQCGQCLTACGQTQAANPRGPLLYWVTEAAAQWESAFNAHLAAERYRHPAGSCATLSNRTCHVGNGD